jgi:hypothetical protein
VWCEGKGPEHPTFNLLRYVGPLKTGPGGVLKPWLCYGNGWTMWAAMPYWKGGEARADTGGWVRIGQAEAAASLPSVP